MVNSSYIVVWLKNINFFMLFRLILSWCLMSSFVAFSAPVIKRDNLTYEVNGLTVQEVRKQIDHWDQCIRLKKNVMMVLLCGT